LRLVADFSAASPTACPPVGRWGWEEVDGVERGPGGHRRNRAADLDWLELLKPDSCPAPFRILDDHELDQTAVLDAGASVRART